MLCRGVLLLGPMGPDLLGPMGPDPPDKLPAHHQPPCRRNHVLATVYMARSDVAYTVRTGAATTAPGCTRSVHGDAAMVLHAPPCYQPQPRLHQALFPARPHRLQLAACSRASHARDGDVTNAPLVSSCHPAFTCVSLLPCLSGCSRAARVEDGGDKHAQDAGRAAAPADGHHHRVTG